MGQENLKLSEPSLEYQEDYLAMAREYLAADSPDGKAPAQEAIRDFPGYVHKLRDWSEGCGLPAGYVPCTTYWLIRDDKTIVAESNLRHRLTPALEQVGGHIGYRTRPSERRKGYGTIICALTLHKAREKGMKRILITCDADNVASARIIEQNGGKLENRAFIKETGKMKNRYWIELQDTGARNTP